MPECPDCGSDEVKVEGKKNKCLMCGFTWSNDEFETSNEESEEEF